MGSNPLSRACHNLPGPARAEAQEDDVRIAIVMTEHAIPRQPRLPAGREAVRDCRGKQDGEFAGVTAVRVGRSPAIEIPIAARAETDREAAAEIFVDRPKLRGQPIAPDDFWVAFVD